MHFSYTFLPYLLHLWLKALFISKIKANPFPVGVKRKYVAAYGGHAASPQKAKRRGKIRSLRLASRLLNKLDFRHLTLQLQKTSVPVLVPEMTGAEPRATAANTLSCL